MSFAIAGVYCAAATPLNADLSVDLTLLGAHCRTLLDDGCNGIALLGTTGEANSFSTAERMALLEGVLQAGIQSGQLMPGTGVAAIPETVALTRHALANGVTRVVMLPPFYYKGVSDDGLFEAYARIIEGVGDSRLRIVLYHIPQMSAVPLGHALIARLIEAFPDIVVGIKDSSGDLANMQAIAAAHPGFSVLSGTDPLLLPMLSAGGAGCITAAANLVAPSLRTIFEHATAAEHAAEVQTAHARVSAYRALANTYMQIPTIKAMLALKSGHAGWRRVRAPLMALDEGQIADIAAKLPGLP